MRELLELRIPEENAERVLPVGMGSRLSIVRKVTVDTADPIYEEIGRLQREFRARGEWFFHGWKFHRQYTSGELADAELLYAYPGRTFEPAGEECGTDYVDEDSCPECGGGATQIGPLVLDGRHIPKSPDFAVTTAGEVLVSSKAVYAFRQAALRGAEFGSVLLANRQASPDYLQLHIAGPFVELDPITRFGDGPFDNAVRGRCSRGDLAGLNLLSDVSVRRASLTGADIAATRQMVGTRRGLLRPHRLMLLSPNAWRVVRDSGLKGLVVEVARVV